MIDQQLRNVAVVLLRIVCVHMVLFVSEPHPPPIQEYKEKSIQVTSIVPSCFFTPTIVCYPL